MNPSTTEGRKSSQNGLWLWTRESALSQESKNICRLPDFKKLCAAGSVASVALRGLPRIFGVGLWSVVSEREVGARIQRNGVRIHGDWNDRRVVVVVRVWEPWEEVKSPVEVEKSILLPKCADQVVVGLVGVSSCLKKKIECEFVCTLSPHCKLWIRQPYAGTRIEQPEVLTPFSRAMPLQTRLRNIVSKTYCGCAFGDNGIWYDVGGSCEGILPEVDLSPSAVPSFRGAGVSCRTSALCSFNHCSVPVRYSADLRLKKCFGTTG